MCSLFGDTPQVLWQQQTKSIRIGRVVTSVRLERMFWQVLDQISESEKNTTPELLTRLYDEFAAQNSNMRNFSSFLRVCCLSFLKRPNSGLPYPVETTCPKKVKSQNCTTKYRAVFD